MFYNSFRIPLNFFRYFRPIILEIFDVKNWIFMIFCILIDNYSWKVLYKLTIFLWKLVNFLTKTKDQSLILYTSCENHNISFKTLNWEKNKSEQAFEYQQIPESRFTYAQNTPTSRLMIKDFVFLKKNENWCFFMKKAIFAIPMQLNLEKWP